MSRLLLHLIFLYFVVSLHLHNFEHENYRQQLNNILNIGAWEQGLEVADGWLRKNPHSHYAWYCVGRFSLEAALSRAQHDYFEKSYDAFDKAISLNYRDPRYHYWKANVHNYLARLEGDSKHYQNFLNSMQLACDLDPMNYFYHSIFFEKVVSLFRDPRYLVKPFPRRLLVDSMVNSLNQYLSLKQFYAKKYLIQLCTTLTKSEKRDLLGRPNLHPELRKALELY